MNGVNIGSVIPIAATSETQTFPDDVALKFGTGGTASILYETKDANANELIIALPTGGATDVPVLVIGDQSIVDKDLTLFNGITVPSLALMNADETHYLKIDGAGIIASDTTLTFSPSGQAATLTMTSDGTVTSLIPATGDYLRIGDAASTSRSLDANDDMMVTGDFEVDGATYCDGSINVSGTATFNAQLAVAANGYISTANTDDVDLPIQARDNGLLKVQIANFVGGVDPYVLLGRDDTGVGSGTLTNGTGTFTGSPITLVCGNNTIVCTGAGNCTVVVPVGSTGTATSGTATITGSVQALAAGNNTVTTGVTTGNFVVALTGSGTVTDGVVLQMGSGSVAEAAGHGFGSSWKIGNASSEVEERGSIDLVLVTATNAAEEARFDFNTMAAGAMANMARIGAKGLYLPTSVDSAAVTDEVCLGAYEISAGHRALSISTEEAVVAETDESKMSHKLPVRINGATYNIMLCAT
jgi:hypothetical protein